MAEDLRKGARRAYGALQEHGDHRQHLQGDAAHAHRAGDGGAHQEAVRVRGGQHELRAALQQGDVRHRGGRVQQAVLLAC